MDTEYDNFLQCTTDSISFLAPLFLLCWHFLLDHHESIQDLFHPHVSPQTLHLGPSLGHEFVQHVPRVLERIGRLLHVGDGVRLGRGGLGTLAENIEDPSIGGRVSDRVD